MTFPCCSLEHTIHETFHTKELEASSIPSVKLQGRKESNKTRSALHSHLLLPCQPHPLLPIWTQLQWETKDLRLNKESILILQCVLSYMEKPQNSYSLSAVFQVPFISLNTSRTLNPLLMNGDTLSLLLSPWFDHSLHPSVITPPSESTQELCPLSSKGIPSYPVLQPASHLSP